MRNAPTAKETFGLKDGESKAMDTKLSRRDIAIDEDWDDEELSKKSFYLLKGLFQENDKVELKALAAAIEDSDVEDFTKSFWDGNTKVMGEDKHGAVTRILGFKNVVDGDFMIFFESQVLGNVLHFEGRDFGYDDIDRIAGLLGVQESFRELYKKLSNEEVKSPSGRSSPTESVKLTEYHGKDHKALITLLKITEAFQGNNRYVDDGVELSVSNVADYVYSGDDNNLLWERNLSLAFKEVTKEDIKKYKENEVFCNKLIEIAEQRYFASVVEV